MTENRSEPKSVECGDTNPISEGMKCCRVDALITIDGRGQIVLPKEVREKAKVKAGDKFVVISHESDGKVCCLTLIKADEFGQTVKEVLGPMMKEILK